MTLRGLKTIVPTLNAQGNVMLQVGASAASSVGIADLQILKLGIVEDISGPDRAYATTRRGIA